MFTAFQISFIKLHYANNALIFKSDNRWIKTHFFHIIFIVYNMSFEITEKMIVNSIFGFGTLISVPTEAAPDPLFAEEEAQPL